MHMEKYLAALRDYVTRRASEVAMTSVALPVDSEAVYVLPVASGAAGPTPDASAIAQPALRVLAEQQHVVFLGDPGQGKSYLLRAHAAALAVSPADHFPILVELGLRRESIPEGQKEFRWLKDRIPPQVSAALNDEAWAGLLGHLARGGASVLLDGFDELDANGKRQVADLARTLEGNQVVLASRPQDYGPALAYGFSVYSIQELRLPQIEGLTGRMCRSLATSLKSEDHAGALRQVLDVAEGPAGFLARNPLLLSFLCYTALRGSQERLPTQPAALIGKCIEKLVEWHREHKVPQTWPETLEAAAVFRVLGTLALQSYHDTSGRIQQGIIEQLPAHDRDFLPHFLAARLIERVDSEYTFPLLTLREYFAARAIAVSPDPYREIARHLHDPDWRSIILYVAGSLKYVHASPLDIYLPRVIRAVVKLIGPILNLVSPAAKVAGTAYGAPEAGKIAAEIGKDVVKEFDSAVRGPLEAWFARSRQSIESFVYAIMRHHSRQDRILKRDLRLAAACIGNARDCPEKLAVRVVSSLADYVFRTRGSKSPFELALRQAARCVKVRNHMLVLTSTKGHKHRTTAVRALSGLLFDPEIHDHFQKLSSSDPEMTIHAGYALMDYRLRRWKTADDEAIDRILQLRGRTADTTVREQLLKSSHDTNDWVRAASSFFLKEAAFDPTVQGRLLDMLVGEKNWIAKQIAADSLKIVASEPHLQQALLDLTSHDDQFVRAVAARALQGAVTTSSKVQVTLLTLLGDNDTNVGRAAAHALEEVARNDPNIRQEVLDLTYHSDYRKRRWAALALQLIRSAVTSADPFVRSQLKAVIAVRGGTNLPGFGMKLAATHVSRISS